MEGRLRRAVRSGKGFLSRDRATGHVACDRHDVIHLFAIAVALSCGLGACQQRDRTRVDPLAATVATLAAKAPGMQVIVERGGAIVIDGNYGFADLEHRVPVTRDSVFCIGSISKQFGAAALMQLVEEGKVSLDDPLAKYLPDFPRAERITIRNLLQHTTGIVDFEYAGAWPTSMGLERTTDQVIATFRDLAPLFEPGQQWSYSSSNYVLLGNVLEQIAGEPLARLMKKRVFDRAGLANTRFCDSYELIPHRARGYTKTKNGWAPARWSHLAQFGLAGGICSTAHDLLAWQRALEGGRVVSDASYREMSTPGTLADGQPIHYGLGLSLLRLGDHRRVIHTGGVSGFGAMLEHFPEDKLRIITLANDRSVDVAHELVLDLLKIPPPRAVPIARAQLERFAVQARDLAIGPVRFVVEDDRLVAEALGDRIPLVHIGDGVFQTADHRIRVRFEITNAKVTRVMVAADDAIVTMTPLDAELPAPTESAPVPPAPAPSTEPAPVPTPSNEPTPAPSVPAPSNEPMPAPPAPAP